MAESSTNPRSGHQAAGPPEQNGDKNESAHPPVRTFKPRRRALTPRRAELFARIGPRFTLQEQGPTLDLAEVYGGESDVVLDIGFGISDCLVAMALAQPELDVIGVEVHTPGIAGALAGIEQHGLTNVRLVHGDAVLFLDRLPERSLTGVRIFFPDPWPKVRHHHRRLVRDDIVDRLVSLLRVDGWLHLATDNADYAEQIERVCGAHPDLRGGAVPRPVDRPLTRYEQKGMAAGHTVVDFRYTRIC